MLGIQLEKKRKLFDTTFVDYVLLNWVMLNDNVYLVDFKYMSDEHVIKCSAIIKPEIWCFSIKLPKNIEDVFYVSSDNADPSEYQLQIINEINMHAFKYDYTDFIGNLGYKNDDYYEIQKSILTKYLNELNDKCGDCEAALLGIESGSDVDDVIAKLQNQEQNQEQKEELREEQKEELREEQGHEQEQLVEINYKISEMLFEDTNNGRHNNEQDYETNEVNWKDNNFLSDYMITDNTDDEIEDIYANENLLNKLKDVVKKCNE